MSLSRWMLALLGKCLRERALVINLSGPFEDVSGKRLVLTRGF